MTIVEALKSEEYGHLITLKCGSKEMYWIDDFGGYWVVRENKTAIKIIDTESEEEAVNELLK